MEIKKIITMSMLLAISVVLSILESFIPIFSGIIVGVKLGLANIVIIYVLYKYSFKDALYITVLRVILVGLLRTGLFSITFLFSLSGAIISIIMMSLFKLTKLSIVGVSVIGSISHVIGQLLIACFLLHISLFMLLKFYLPYLIIIACVTGFIIGLISREIIKEVD